MQLSSPLAAQRAGVSRVPRRSARRVYVQALLRPDACAPLDASTAGPSRRGLLAMTAGAFMGLVAVERPAQALTCASETRNDDDDAACRASVLSGDIGSVQAADANYNKLSERKFTAAGGVPVAVLDSEYARSTLKLRDDIITFFATDVQDFKTRVPMIKQLKADSSEWVSKYARGGSARTDSARRTYIAVDALIGHIAANGYAPMPKPKQRVVLSNLDQAKSFLEQGK